MGFKIASPQNFGDAAPLPPGVPWRQCESAVRLKFLNNCPRQEGFSLGSRSSGLFSSGWLCHFFPELMCESRLSQTWCCFSLRGREWAPLSPALPKAILQHLRLICKLVAGIIWRTSLQKPTFITGVWAPGVSTVTSPLPGYLYVPIDLNPSPFLTHWRLLVLFSIAVMAWILKSFF